MRRSRLVAVIMPAALLVFSQAAIAQQPQEPASPGSGMTLAGPDGEEVLEVVKKAPPEVRAGEVFEYQIMVRNVSDSPLMNVTVVEQVDALKIRDAKPQAAAQGQESQASQQQQQTAAQQQAAQEKAAQQKAAEQTPEQKAAEQKKAEQQKAQQQKQQQSQQKQVQQQGNMIRYKVGKLEAGQTRTLTVSAVASKPGPAHACMWVDYQPTLCTTIEVVQPDFQLVGRLLFDRGVEAEGIEGVYKCDELSLELAVTSTGDAPTAPAQASVQLPAGVTTADGKSELQVDLGTIEPEKTIRKEVPLKLDPQQAAGSLELPIAATAGDLKAQVTLPAVKVLDPQLELAVNAPKQAYIKEPVQVPVSVTNPSQAPVLNAVVRVGATAGFDEFTAEGVEMSEDGAIAIGRLEPGQTREFTLLMSASKPTDANLTVTAEGYCVAAQEKKATMSLQGIPAVLIEVVDKVDPVPVGENTVYEIAVKNQGTAADTNIQLTATLPESVEFVRGDGQTEVTAEGANVTFAALDELAPGDVVSWTVQVKASQADKARLKVELKSDATDEPIVEEEPTTLYGDSPPATQQQQTSQQPEPQQQEPQPQE